MQTSKISFSCSVQLPFEEAVKKTKEALKAEGFGVITEIDVKKTIREKLGADFRQYMILGACNPQLVHEALTKDLDVGLLLPCNVIVYEELGKVVVSVVDPGALLGILEDKGGLQPLGKKAATLLKQVIGSLESLSGS